MGNKGKRINEIILLTENHSSATLQKDNGENEVQ